MLTDSLPTLLSQNQTLKIQEPNIENRLEFQLAETQKKLSKLDLRRYQSQFYRVYLHLAHTVKMPFVMSLTSSMRFKLVPYTGSRCQSNRNYSMAFLV